MQIIQRTVVDAPTDQVWQVLARRFGDISAWASAVSESASVPSPTGEPVGAGRTVRTSFGELRETLVRYDERGRSLGYRAEGLPFPVAGSTNDWSVRPRGPGRAEVETRLNFRFRPFIGVVAGPLVRLAMGRTIRQPLEELKHYVETGRPHPRKKPATRPRPAGRGGPTTPTRS